MKHTIKIYLLSGILISFCLMWSSFVPNEKEIRKALVPSPKQYNIYEGYFNSVGKIHFNILPNNGLDEKSIRLALGKRLQLTAYPSPTPPEKGLALIWQNPQVKVTSPEAYQLQVQESLITVTANTVKGMLMGLRTLAQLALDGPIPKCHIADWPDMTLRASHLCYHLVRENMAYNCPNFDSLIKQVDRLASVKQNAVLLELESMFPYKKHSVLSCKIAFTDSQVVALRNRLQTHQMEIIPLVQCLGHAYNVLVHDEYASYRELPDHIQQYCPTNSNVADMYMEFVDEYLRVFPDLKYWHMGGDESRLLGRCPRCREKIENLGVSRLYVDFITEIARRIHERGLTPMIWSDMLEHHPEALSLIPSYVTIVYWNYDLPTWPRPYVAKEFMDKGFRVIGASGVRFGSSGTELSVYYHETLRGIESLTKRLFTDGCKEIITTNWMKGSPHENTDYGFLYAADLAWDIKNNRQNFKRRYAKVAYGLDDPSICDVYETLSLWLPYAEPVQKHMPDRLNRFDLSGLRFQEKWQRYTKPDNEPKVLQDLNKALYLSKQADKSLSNLVLKCTRGKGQLNLLQLSSQSIQAKARLALAMHQGNQLKRETSSKEAILKFSSEIPTILGAWHTAKEEHMALLTTSGFEPSVTFLNEIMFEPAEADFLTQMGQHMAATVHPDKNYSEITIPFLDNPGNPYERGLKHGQAFRQKIRESVKKWCYGYQPNPSDWYLTMKKRMFNYVSEQFPDIIQEMQGIADGAGLSLDDIFWLNSFNAIGRIAKPAQCSTIFLRGKDNQIFMGKTSDIDAQQRKEMLLRRVRYKDADFYVIGWIGTVWVESALTRSGLVFGCNSGHSHPKQSGHGIPQHFGAYPMLFKAQTVKQTVDFFTKIEFAGKGLIMGLADANGNAVVIEKSGTAQGVRQVKKNNVLAVNIYESEEMRAYNYDKSAAMAVNSKNRKDRFDAWVAKKSFEDPLNALLSLMAETKHKGSLCQTGQDDLYTEAAVILLPKLKQIMISGLPPDKRQYLRYGFEN